MINLDTYILFLNISRLCFDTYTNLQVFFMRAFLFTRDDSRVQRPPPQHSHEIPMFRRYFANHLFAVARDQI